MRKLWRRGADSPLDAAAVLIEKGRLLEAIDLLTQANRQDRDVRIEEQLLELRYQAGAAAPGLAARTKASP